MAYEQKLDGHRALLFTAAGPGGSVLVQTRRGALVQDRWPDLVAAAEAQLPPGLVLDGELLVWDIEAGRLSFEALQRRAATRARGAPALAAKWPAYFVAFDLLQQHGQELLTRPYAERRTLLEGLFSEHALTAPWTLCPQTTDLAKARECLESWTDVSGVEGILIKPLNSRYLPGYRGWRVDCTNSSTRPCWRASSFGYSSRMFDPGLPRISLERAESASSANRMSYEASLDTMANARASSASAVDASPARLSATCAASRPMDCRSWSRASVTAGGKETVICAGICWISSSVAMGVDSASSLVVWGPTSTGSLARGNCASDM
ncbi:ATP-dependent DNA ligase [Streptomyces sp. NPDC055796]